VPDVNVLLDQLASDAELQRQWELNPVEVLDNYTLSPSQREALLNGDVETLMSEGLAERHVQQMRVSW
jgi:hypothetical protein